MTTVRKPVDPIAVADRQEMQAQAATIKEVQQVELKARREAAQGLLGLVQSKLQGQVWESMGHGNLRLLRNSQVKAIKTQVRPTLAWVDAEPTEPVVFDELEHVGQTSAAERHAQVVRFAEVNLRVDLASRSRLSAARLRKCWDSTEARVAKVFQPNYDSSPGLPDRFLVERSGEALGLQRGQDDLRTLFLSFRTQLDKTGRRERKSTVATLARDSHDALLSLCLALEQTANSAIVEWHNLEAADKLAQYVAAVQEDARGALEGRVFAALEYSYALDVTEQMWREVLGGDSEELERFFTEVPEFSMPLGDRRALERDVVGIVILAHANNRNVMKKAEEFFVPEAVSIASNAGIGI